MMTTPAYIQFDKDRLIIKDEAARLDEWRELKTQDQECFKAWIVSYRAALEHTTREKALLAIGQEMYAWLDGDERWLEKMLDAMSPPFFMELRVASRRPTAAALEFLEAPWELLADENGHLAADAFTLYCPIRRIGPPGKPEKPSPFRLNCVFMAAAPRNGGASLNYEDEEAAILKASGAIGMDLTVEESGTLPFLAECLAREKPVDVLHLSCHGSDTPEPVLILENDEGAKAPCSAMKLSQQIAGNLPRLLFVSACLTSAPDALLNTFSASLLRMGAPAVLGWGGSVQDVEATRFAQEFYRVLSQSNTCEQAAARARFNLLTPDKTHSDANVSRDWHLARLYVGSKGGGVFCDSTTARRPRSALWGHREFLNAKDKQIPVAGRNEFVGRRRQIQTVLKHLRTFHHAGVLIHGFGRQGKSSLAARIANRRPDLQPVVIYGRYDALSILNQISSAADAKTKDHIEAARENVRNDPANLFFTLKELLEGSFSGTHKAVDGSKPRRALLLIIDDFEQALDAPSQKGGLHRVKKEFNDAIRSVIQAFDTAATDSRLLFTSRYRFNLTYNGRNMADKLADLPLPPMRDYEGRKQAAAKEKALPDLKTAKPERIERCIKMARGNPGLQDLLFGMACQAPQQCDQALDDMDAYIRKGREPDEARLLEFMQNLAVERLIALLSPSEKELLRASTLFEMPVPQPVLEILVHSAGLDSYESLSARLISLGLWDVYTDPVNPDMTAWALNDLVRPRIDLLSDDELTCLAQAVIQDLFKIWGGADSGERPYSADYELTRLALIAEDAAVLAATTAKALYWLAEKFAYRDATAIAQQAMSIIDKAGVEASPQLLRIACERCEQTGAIGPAKEYIRRAVKFYHTERKKGKSIQERDYAFALGRQAGLLQMEGEVDEALKLHQEAMQVYDELGDRRSRAVTLGDIARIMVDKGEVDEALKLHQEEMQVYDELGDRRSRA
ncbi:CHAT domain-containing protein, partial [Desulfococcaceae bacterium HSG9]|nr:CHAT domain-containing protein [Desulfococcaceae bacterium HSG9]